MSDLGDISELLKEGSLSNLDWLSVPEDAPQVLPMQNLDIVPELEAAWSHADSVSPFIPNLGDAPRTMGDMSQAHGKLQQTAQVVLRTARYAVMQYPTNLVKVIDTLKSRFSSQDLAESEHAVREVVAQRGLLGGYYIEASDFPGCSSGAGSPAKFVQAYAKEARFVRAKKECQDCIHRQANRCAVFLKEVVVEVPYTTSLAEWVEQNNAHRGITPAPELGAQSRVARALLTQPVETRPEFTGVPQRKVAGIRLASSDAGLGMLAHEQSLQSKQASLAIVESGSRPVLDLLRKELIKGRSAKEALSALRLAFDLSKLQATRSEWEPVFREAGIYGVAYLNADDFDCHKGADLVTRHKVGSLSVVAGKKCGTCLFSQGPNCTLYSRPLVATASEAISDATVSAVVTEHTAAGRLPGTAFSMKWGADARASLKAIHEAASSNYRAETTRIGTQTAFYGSSRVASTGALTKSRIVQATQRYMNEGLYGSDLRAVLAKTFERRDLLACQSELRAVLAEQGLQGIKYVDPTVYEDYGKGCATASRLHRSRASVRYAKVGSKCHSCVHQSMPGVCSQLNKQLVEEPPYANKLAEQQAVLNSGRSTEIDFSTIVGSHLTMMQEYNLQHNGTIDLNPEAPEERIAIEFNNQEVVLP